jgi:predicted DNA-binding protein (MmcQ/YjbR family)
VITNKEVIAYALNFPEAVELPHFEKKSFRVKKKIFATLDLSKQRAVLKLTPLQQSVFCDPEKMIMYPAPGSWGKQGWTIAELKKIRKKMLKDALAESYYNVAPKSVKK